MPRFKPTVFKLLVALVPLFAAPQAAAADRVFDVTKAGVVGDGATLDTAGLQNAIDDCAAPSSERK
jgi:polygalacturonase